MRLLRTNSSKTTFEENIRNLRVRLRMRGYPRHLLDYILSEVKFTERESALQQRQKTQDKPLPFVTQYHPSVPHLKKILMGKWPWIESQPLLREIYNTITKSGNCVWSVNIFFISRTSVTLLTKAVCKTAYKRRV